MVFPGLKWEVREVGLSVAPVVVIVMWVIGKRVTKSLVWEAFAATVKHPGKGIQ